MQTEPGILSSALISPWGWKTEQKRQPGSLAAEIPGMDTGTVALEYWGLSTISSEQWAPSASRGADWVDYLGVMSPLFRQPVSPQSVLSCLPPRSIVHYPQRVGNR